MQVESEARNPYTALKRRYATLQRNALHVQNALVRALHTRCTCNDTSTYNLPMGVHIALTLQFAC